jgi:hypothetical protein
LDVAEAVGGEFEELVAETARPHDVALALLRQMRGRRPAVLVLEDVHWADEATLDVLTLLASRIVSVPALLLASHRDEEGDRSEQLRIVSAHVGARDRLRVTSLSRLAVKTLAEPHGIDDEELYHRTGGNPFFVTEVLAAGGGPIPETVRDAVLSRAAPLSVEAKRLLEAVAIFPGRVELWLLDAVAPELTARLEECLASGMLTTAGSGVAFRHELAREAVEGSVAPDRLLALHRAALTALAAPPVGDPDPERLAHHSEAVEDGQGVLRWAPRAAARAATCGRAPRGGGTVCARPAIRQ